MCANVRGASACVVNVWMYCILEQRMEGRDTALMSLRASPSAVVYIIHPQTQFTHTHTHKQHHRYLIGRCLNVCFQCKRSTRTLSYLVTTLWMCQPVVYMLCRFPVLYVHKVTYVATATEQSVVKLCVTFHALDCNRQAVHPAHPNHPCHHATTQQRRQRWRFASITAQTPFHRESLQRHI